MRTPNSDDRNLAAWYRSTGLRLDDIATILGKSAARVSRLVAEAEAAGLLEHRWELTLRDEDLESIRNKLRDWSAESEILSRWRSLQSCIVVDPRRSYTGDRGDGSSTDVPLAAVGHAAAVHFRVLCGSHHAGSDRPWIGGIAWGVSARAFVEGLKAICPTPMPQLRVVPTCGYLQPRRPRWSPLWGVEPYPDVSAQTLAQQFAATLGCETPALFVGAPGVIPLDVEEAELPRARAAYQGDPGYRRLFAADPPFDEPVCRRLSFLVSGIGGLGNDHQWAWADRDAALNHLLAGWKPEHERRVIEAQYAAAEDRDSVLDELLQERLSEEGIVGDINALYVRREMDGSAHAPLHDAEGIAGKLNARSQVMRIDDVRALAERARANLGSTVGTVVIAVGERKRNIVRLALEDGSINHLVTDWRLAEALLEPVHQATQAGSDAAQASR